MKTKLHLIILCLLLFLAGGGSVIHAADSWSYPTSKPDGKFGGGSGSYYDPYLINNAQQLADLAYMVNQSGRSGVTPTAFATYSFKVFSS